MLLSVLTTDVWWFTWIVLPLLIFLARVADVSIGTLRLIFVSKGMKRIAPVIGFFEVIIWLIAVAQIMQHLDNWLCYIAYGAGFAAGNYIGMLMEERIALGNVIVRTFLQGDNEEFINKVKEANYGITIVDAKGSKGGDLKVVFSIIRRKEVEGFISILHDYYPSAFYTIEEIKALSSGVFRPTTSSGNSLIRKTKLPWLRK
ncbi:MAG: DUF2179 domain-containing protein [Lentimicrobiaceae bacterium]|nr:DUF2179 domain-containing protein [Lentimicrobiaceae bacterium]